MTKQLKDMTWQEAKEAFKTIKLAIIPTGSMEQHGPHLPLGTDFIIANVHWGVEYTHYFNDHQQDIAHQLIDSGVDMIIGHHPHVVQGMEVYNSKPIFYSLGNFIFDQYFSKETQEGLGVGITINDSGADLYLFPYQSVNKYLELLSGKEKDIFYTNFMEWSEGSIDMQNGKISI